MRRRPLKHSTRHPHVMRRPQHGTPPRAVVIGGGLAGLASAGLLARDGYDVDLIEARETVGGRVDTCEIKGFTFDIGPTWYLMGEVMEHFFALMGADIANYCSFEPLTPAYRLFRDTGEHIDVVSGREEVSQLFESQEPGAGQRIREHLASAERTYTLALKYFLYTNFEALSPWCRREILRDVPTLIRLLTESLETHADKVVADPVLRQMLTFHAVFLSAAPAMLPSMYHLMAHLDLNDGVVYPVGGMRTLVEAVESVVKDAGVRIHTSTRAEEILTQPGGRGRCRATASGVRIRDANGRVEEMNADTVVSTIDLWASETHLLPPELQTYPQAYWEKSRHGIGTVLAMIGVKGQLPELAHHSFFFTSDWEKNFSQIFGEHPSIPDPASIYVCRSSATDVTAAPEGHETLFILVPVPADDLIGHGSIDRDCSGDEPCRAGDDAVEQVIDAAIAQVSSWANIPDLAERVVVRRTLGPADHSARYGSFHGNAFGPAHVLSQSAFMRARSRSSYVDSLLFAGQTTAPGIGVPMAFINAENVLKRLHGDTSALPIPEPPDAPRHSVMQQWHDNNRGR